MRHRFPSLNALKAFEAAGRHESLSRAAKELSVTPGAVGRQIAQLEAHLGCSLFIHMGRGLRLTDTGQHFLRTLSTAFDLIDTATDQVLGASLRSASLSIRALPTIATEWLVPRLQSFRTAYPDIAIRLMASLQAADFAQSDTDMGIIITHGNAADVDFEVLFNQTFTPICSPSYLARSQPLQDPSDITRQTLLHSPKQMMHWKAWFDMAGVKNISLDAGLWFENSSLTYQAAREGAGIALGQPLFLLDDFDQGRLVAPFGLEFQSEKPYCLAISKRRRHEPAINAFRTWILNEARETLARRDAKLRSAPQPSLAQSCLSRQPRKT